MEKLIKELSIQTDSKIVLLVLDGLGGLRVDGQTELEAAKTPNLDQLAANSSCGLTDPVSMGITPGSGPAHMSLFGYDPLFYLLGRGILEALGVGVNVGKNDMVARGNFATLKDGLIIDRRAGRIPTSENEKLCQKINNSIQSVMGAHTVVYPGKEHRFVVKFSKHGLMDALTDADPQKENKPVVYSQAKVPEAEESARIINAFTDKVTDLLRDNTNANTVMLRGFSKHPSIPTMQELFHLKAAAIANYPMYKGLAKLVGMNILDVGTSQEDLVTTLEEHYNDYDFFYVHVKKTDSAGEDGNFSAKVAAIEKTDTYIPRFLDLNPDVLAVTSDHSTPSFMKGHSWHPNPILIHARTAQGDPVDHFSERACCFGYLGRFHAIHVIPLLLAHAGKLKKYGA
jgi:2,3-bisphosphoglycerate-independent phosphoglycerate mutase